MRLIVPLQGIVQGRGGLILGSVIPCALFYFFQLYHKKIRKSSSSSNDNDISSNSPSKLSPTSSNADLLLHRSSSRASLSSSAPARISSRAAPFAEPNVSPFYLGMDQVRENPYHEVDNPDGIIHLGQADNFLSLDLIEKWLAENWGRSISNDGEQGITEIATYQPLDGMMELKMAMADFLSDILGNVSFDPSQLVLTCGATPAIEILMFCLSDPGNAFLIPAPYYPGFDRNVMRTGVELVPIHCRSSDNFSLSITALEQAYNNARKRGLKVRGIIFANPSNPVGNLFSREMLYSILDFAREKNIHIISDEVFEGTIYRSEEFLSMAELVESEEIDKNRVHIICGLSKTLSLTGFRVGAIYTSNDSVLAAAKKMARFSSISAPTQRLVVSMLSDKGFIKEFIETNNERLRRMHDSFAAGLAQLGIPCASSDAGFFCWADFSRFITPCNEIGEVEFWEKLLNIGKLNVTPGSAFHCVEPGWFRCCFAFLAEHQVPLVMERIRKVCDIGKSSI